MGTKRKAQAGLSNQESQASQEAKKAKRATPSSRATRSRRSSVDKNALEVDTRLTRNKAKELGAILLTQPADPEALLRSKTKTEDKHISDSKEASDMERSNGQGTNSNRNGHDDDEELGNDAGRSTLQGLLRRLGAGFEDIFPHGHVPGGGGGGGGSRIKNILTMIRDEDEMQQLTGLTELCEYISISTEESMVSFPIEQVVPLLVSILGYEHNPDLMLLAARGLTFLADVFPPACGAIVRHGAVQAFCARLLTIEYIDLAEQSLQALEKLSHDHREALLREGALIAVLSYIDFFQTGVQRVAVATAANICRNVSIDHAEAVATAVPILINLLQYQDAKIVDSACLALTRIAESYSKNPTQMEMLCSFGLISNIVEMVAVSDGGSITSQLTSSTFYGLVKLLSTCSRGSALVAQELLGAGVSATLRKLMDTSPLLSATAASPGNALRSSEQLEDLVSLAAQILPGLPDATAAVLLSKDDAAIAEESGTPDMLAEYLGAHPEVASTVATDLLAVLLKVYSSSGTQAVKRPSLLAISRLLYHTPADSLRALLKELPVSSWVASLLNSRDAAIAARGMQAANILMEKLPEVFSVYFLKEGVVHAMEELVSSEESSMDQKASETTPGIATRRRSQISLPSRLHPGTVAGSVEEQQKQQQSLKSDSRTSAATEGLSNPLRAALAKAAKKFLDDYFTGPEGKTMACDSEGVRRLKELSARLPDPAAIPDILSVLCATGEDSISTFELLSSGVLHALRVHLRGEDLNAEDACKGPVTEEQQKALLQRLSVFAQAALPQGSGRDPIMVGLVQKLLGGLGALDKFEVRLTPINVPSYTSSPYGMYFNRGGLQRTSGTSGSLSSSLAALTNPLKIRLCKAGDESSLKDYSNNVVLIEPLASMAQVEDFLWPRVHTSASLANEGGPRSGPTTTTTNVAGTSRATATAAAAAAASDATAATASDAGKNKKPSATTNPTASRRPEASKTRPIPQAPAGRRMTRAQARAAAEAEVASMGRPPREEEEDEYEDVVDEMDASPIANDRGKGDDSMSEGDPDLLLEQTPGTSERKTGAPRPSSAAAAAAAGGGGGGNGSPTGDIDHQHYRSFNEEDDDDEDDYDEDDEYVEGDADADEDDIMNETAMHVHDMHLGGEGEDAVAAAAAVAAAQHAIGTTAAAAATENQPSRGGSSHHHHHHHRSGSGHSYARATAGSSRGSGRPLEETRLAFYINGKPIDVGSTVFQAIQAALGAGNAASQSSSTDVGSRIWGEVHTLTYRTQSAAVRLKEEKGEAGSSRAHAAAGAIVGAAGAVGNASVGVVSGSTEPMQSLSASLLSDLLPKTAQFSKLEDVSEDVVDVLEVLRLLEALNRLGPRLLSHLAAQQGRVLDPDALSLGQVPRETFISGRLGPKLAQQLKDVISICGGALPPWCDVLTSNARFLFPFDVRRRYFYCTALGLPRALLYLQQTHQAEHPENAAERDTGGLRLGRVQRQKVRISRRRLLDSAHKVFELYSGPKNMLEIEFFGEVGTGLGPTLEFYTLLSHELQRKSLNLWRHDASAGANLPLENAKELAGIPTGLTGGVQTERKDPGPGPLKGELSMSAAGPDADHLGERDLVTAPFGLFPSPLLPQQRNDASKISRHFKLLGRVVAKALQDMRLLDLPLSPVFYRLVLGRKVDLLDLRRIDPALGASLERLHAAQVSHAAKGTSGPIIVDGATVEDLCLSFALPGRPDFELCPAGADVSVTSDNLSQYLDAVVDATLGSGVKTQVEAFRAGFNDIFALDALAPFYVDEIEAMLCGTGEHWTVEGLAAVIKLDHGYTASSPVVKALLEILADLDSVDQRRFLRFVTGTPRLPPGGLGALQPRLTVVRKLSTQLSTQLSGLEAALASSMPGNSAPSDPAGSLPVGGVARTVIDGDLPSVMTCANYLKLPPYSSKEILKERLLFAIREGQGSFDLS